MIQFTKTYTEILELVAAEKDRQTQIEMLRSFNVNGDGLINFLRFVFDPDITVLLPKEDIPYKAADAVEIEGRMHNEARKLYIFVANAGLDKLSDERRVQLFIQILESIDPNDAKLLHAAKNRKMLIKGIDAHLVNEAFPGLLTGYDKIVDEPEVEAETNPMPVIEDTVATEEEIAKVMERVTTTPAPVAKKKPGRRKSS